MNELIHNIRFETYQAISATIAFSMFCYMAIALGSWVVRTLKPKPKPRPGLIK